MDELNLLHKILFSVLRQNNKHNKPETYFKIIKIHFRCVFKVKAHFRRHRKSSFQSSFQSLFHSKGQCSGQILEQTLEQNLEQTLE